MSYELIITEKPSAAKNIANALDNGKPVKESINSVPYYKVTRGNKDLVVVCAVGHLYGLAQKGTKTWTYPMFDIEWVPNADVDKNAAFSKKYLNVIKKLAKEASDFTVACDYDIEGEVIGLNIVRFACKQKDAGRMKFSTQMKEDLIKAYDTKAKHLDWGQANAGETRHILDWFYGINLSRALTDSIKAAGSFKVMSSGRVQGPALKLFVEREKEIKAFIPDPYWQIELNGSVKRGDILAVHQTEKFWEKEIADAVMKNVSGAKEALIADVERKKFQQQPPTPFDLTSLQLEAHKTCGIPPKQTLSIAQELYTSQLISYPRTSSQKLPASIGFSKILKLLEKQFPEAGELLKQKVLMPNEGKKSDPAHPAIYPTGMLPRGLEDRKLKLYNLIVRRFMATFGNPATRETVTVTIDCKKELFRLKGTLTVEKGWHVQYGEFIQFKEEELPPVVKGDVVTVTSIDILDKETQPSKRYTEASVIKALEKENVGTKATRASIIETLFARGYVDGKPIYATDLGIKTVETLEKYCPDIISVDMTRHFEEEMEKISEGTKKEEDILSEARDVLVKLLKKFDEQKKTIGENLLSANRESMDKAAHVGTCKKCGDELQIRRGKFGQFISCKNYEKCESTFSLPQGLIKPANKECKECMNPVVLVIKARRRPQEVCINKDCVSKKLEKTEADKLDNLAGNKCPNCEPGKMAIKSSLFGRFAACDQYPKCRTTQKPDGTFRVSVPRKKKTVTRKKTTKKTTKKKNMKKIIKK